MYFFITGAAVPTIQQFFGQVRTRPRTLSAFSLNHNSSKLETSLIFPMDSFQ